MTDAEPIKTRLRELADGADATQCAHLRELIGELRHLAGPAPTYATVILFKPSGKYYAEESWLIPDGAITPHDMVRSLDFKRISGGAVYVPEQEPWGYPALLIGE